MSYTAEQMFILLRELHTMKAKSADMIISKHWEEVHIKHDKKDFRTKTYGAPVMESYTVTVEAPDGANGFIAAVWCYEGASQDTFDGPYVERKIYGFSQHDGDWGNAGPMAEQWYHAMRFRLAGGSV